MVEKLVALVRRQIESVMELVESHERSSSGAFDPTPVRHSSRYGSIATWESISLEDWTNILESILLLSGGQSFCEEFGKETIDMRIVVRKIWTHTQARRACAIAPVVIVPESLADKDHWGHLVWMFCNFKKEVHGKVAREVAGEVAGEVTGEAAGEVAGEVEEEKKEEEKEKEKEKEEKEEEEEEEEDRRSEGRQHLYFLPE
jgi:hypothetical protein